MSENNPLFGKKTYLSGIPAINYRIVLAISLCLLLTGIPVLGESFVLGVYGNANLDDTIDDADLTFLQNIIDGKEKKTLYADATNDGKIDTADLERVKEIIAGSAPEITIEDYDKKVKTVKQPVEDIITTYAYETEAVESLGMSDKIRAVDKSTIDREGFISDELRTLPSVGVWDNYDLESIISLKPDLVVIFMRSWLGEGNAQIDSVIESAVPDSTVISVMPRNKGEWMGEMAKLAYAIGAAPKWNDLKEFLESVENQLDEKISTIPADKRLQVLLINMGHSELPEGLMTAGKDNVGLRNVLIAAGGDNIGDILPGDSVEIDPEWVIEQNPDVIVIAMPSSHMGYYQDSPAKVEDFFKTYTEKSWIQQTNAGKNNRIYLIDWPLMQNEWFIGEPYLAKMLYPDLFEDLNPQEIHQEFLKTYMTTDYNIQDKGVFAYP